MRRDPADILDALDRGELDALIGAPERVFGPGGYFSSHIAFITDLERIWKNFKLSYFKRIQAPPILTVSRRAFGYDLEEAQNGVYFSRKYNRVKKRILGI